MRTILAVLVVGVAVIGFFMLMARGPGSLRAMYERDIARRFADREPTLVVGEEDLAHLPRPVQNYLRLAGVVGRPRVYNMRVRMDGRIRSGPDTSWMPFRAEQYSFIDEPARLFYMSATMSGIPVQGYHRYAGASASMTIKAAATVPVVNASGEDMHQAETVTMFNDMCLMAPATLIDPRITWEEVSANVSRATFSNAGHTIAAELTFNDAGELTNFVSDDRSRLSPDGERFEKVRWSTPVDGYRWFGSVLLPAGGEARWHDASGEYPYAQLAFDEIVYNVGSR